MDRRTRLKVCRDIRGRRGAEKNLAEVGDVVDLVIAEGMLLRVSILSSPLSSSPPPSPPRLLSTQPLRPVARQLAGSAGRPLPRPPPVRTSASGRLRKRRAAAPVRAEERTGRRTRSTAPDSGRKSRSRRRRGGEEQSRP
eukprot:760852-Hanusia_phi.AAC.1